MERERERLSPILWFHKCLQQSGLSQVPLICLQYLCPPCRWQDPISEPLSAAFSGRLTGSWTEGIGMGESTPNTPAWVIDVSSRALTCSIRPLPNRCMLSKCIIISLHDIHCPSWTTGYSSLWFLITAHLVTILFHAFVQIREAFPISQALSILSVLQWMETISQSPNSTLSSELPHSTHSILLTSLYNIFCRLAN